jgi:glycine/D-amino acid oxidase-like deaminating enzyme
MCLTSDIQVSQFIWFVCRAGHYDYNTFDQNSVIDRHHHIRNFIFANGFSGHGLQQAPAVGLGVSELIRDGKFQTLDLSPLNFARINQGKHLLERNIV